MKKLIVFISCIFLASCAASNIKEQKNFANSVEFTVDESYQRVYNNLLEKIHECKGETWTGEFASYRIRNELFNERREGHITFIISNAGSQIYYIHIDIASVADKKTKAKAYVYYPTQEDYLSLIKQWAFDGNSGCELSELSSD